jgi:hypothetical protein
MNIIIVVVCQSQLLKFIHNMGRATAHIFQTATLALHRSFGLNSKIWIFHLNETKYFSLEVPTVSKSRYFNFCRSPSPTKLQVQNFAFSFFFDKKLCFQFDRSKYTSEWLRLYTRKEIDWFKFSNPAGSKPREKSSGRSMARCCLDITSIRRVEYSVVTETRFCSW